MDILVLLSQCIKLQISNHIAENIKAYFEINIKEALFMVYTIFTVIQTGYPTGICGVCSRW